VVPLAVSFCFFLRVDANLVRWRALCAPRALPGPPEGQVAISSTQQPKLPYWQLTGAHTHWGMVFTPAALGEWSYPGVWFSRLRRWGSGVAASPNRLSRWQLVPATGMRWQLVPPTGTWGSSGDGGINRALHLHPNTAGPAFFLCTRIRIEAIDQVLGRCS
jgi:hypothetical protein